MQRRRINRKESICCLNSPVLGTFSNKTITGSPLGKVGFSDAASKEGSADSSFKFPSPGKAGGLRDEGASIAAESFTLSAFKGGCDGRTVTEKSPTLVQKKVVGKVPTSPSTVGNPIVDRELIRLQASLKEAEEEYEREQENPNPSRLMLSGYAEECYRRHRRLI